MASFGCLGYRSGDSGQGLDPAKVERAVNLSADKYCSAKVMLGDRAKISHEIEIVDSGVGLIKLK
jgi:putative redox protein|tara:strand:- start:947 stop:1141 length:195 start_codon:yes stop_codon:yes gene_type:complete